VTQALNLGRLFSVHFLPPYIICYLRFGLWHASSEIITTLLFCCSDGHAVLSKTFYQCCSIKDIREESVLRQILLMEPHWIGLVPSVRFVLCLKVGLMHVNILYMLMQLNNLNFWNVLALFRWRLTKKSQESSFWVYIISVFAMYLLPSYFSTNGQIGNIVL
jgi:hypothetical protein